MLDKPRFDDHEVCRAIRAGRVVVDQRALLLAYERGLVCIRGAGIDLTAKGNALLDGIEPSACSGWHMNELAPSPYRRKGGRQPRKTAK